MSHDPDAFPGGPGRADGRAEAGGPAPGAAGVGWRVEAITAFVRGDPLLYTTYLFFAQGAARGSAGAFAIDSVESYFAFLVWFLAKGRAGYGPPLVIPERVREAVSAPDAAGRHPMMAFLRDDEGGPAGGDAARLWYYLDAVPRHGLAPYLSRGELVRLAASAPTGRARGSELERLVEATPALGAAARASGFAALLSHLAARAGMPPRLPAVSIVGLHRSVLGLGEDARRLFDCFLAAGVAPELVDVSPRDLERDGGGERFRAFEAARPHAPVVIFCLPAFETLRAILQLGLGRATPGQYRIGYWAWETTALPANWRHAYDFVDEIWASSTFLGEVYANETDKPVVYVPLHVRAERPAMDEELRPLFGGFTVLSVFDFNSRIERKNPLGSIAAFRKAFPPDVGDARLILKTLHADHRTGDVAALRRAIGDDERIVIVDGALSREHLCGLIAAADAYLSLHRAEGFGRPLAEAMLLGTPVVATGWSGPADFLTPETGYPVRSTLRPVAPHEYANAAGDWAEPDVDHAAEHLRRLHRDGGAPPHRLAAARRIVEETFSREAVASILQAHLTTLTGP